jgi:hypothetical protein
MTDIGTPCTVSDTSQSDALNSTYMSQAVADIGHRSSTATVTINTNVTGSTDLGHRSGISTVTINTNVTGSTDIGHRSGIATVTINTNAFRVPKVSKT